MYENRMGLPIYLSERAQELLNDGTLTEIFMLIEGDMKEEWGRTPEATQREALYHELQALTRVRLKLTTLVDNLRFQRDN